MRTEDLALVTAKLYTLDQDQQPVAVPATRAGLIAWGSWMERAADRKVAESTVRDCRVSTVFLGIDHRHGGDGPPVLWETMVFHGEGDTDDDLLTRRYTSRADAFKGHHDTVRRLREQRR